MNKYNSRRSPSLRREVHRLLKFILFGRVIAPREAYIIASQTLFFIFYFFLANKVSNYNRHSALRTPHSALRISHFALRIPHLICHFPFAICNFTYAFFPVTVLITNKVPIIRAIAIGRTIIQFETKPAMMYATVETPATVNA